MAMAKPCRLLPPLEPWAVVAELWAVVAEPLAVAAEPLAVDSPRSHNRTRDEESEEREEPTSS